MLVASHEQQELHRFDNFVLYARYITPAGENILASEGGYRGSKSFLFTATALGDKRILSNEKHEEASEAGKSAEKFEPNSWAERSEPRRKGGGRRVFLRVAEGKRKAHFERRFLFDDCRVVRC